MVGKMDGWRMKKRKYGRRKNLRRGRGIRKTGNSGCQFGMQWNLLSNALGNIRRTNEWIRKKK